jgi:hypothetical protein
VWEEGREAVGFQNPVPPLSCGFSCAFVLVDQTAEDRSAPDPLLVEVRDRMIGSWREKAKRSVWPPPVVVGAVLRKDGP